MAKLSNSPGWKIPAMFSSSVFATESWIYLPTSVNDFLETWEGSSKEKKFIFRVFDEVKGVSDETVSFSGTFSPAKKDLIFSP